MNGTDPDDDAAECAIDHALLRALAAILGTPDWPDDPHLSPDHSGDGADDSLES